MPTPADIPKAKNIRDEGLCLDEKNLLICDKDFGYANMLCENIMQRKELAFRVCVCTNVENLLQFAEQREIHVLIVNEDFTPVEWKEQKAKQVFVLTNDIKSGGTGKEYQLYKYQSADLIIADMLEVLYEKTKDSVIKSVRKSTQTIFAVYSPIHRIGKTAFAIEMGKEYAKRKRTLYINMEEYADVGERFVFSESRNLGDLLYYMRQEEQNVAMRISSMVVKKDELDYIPPMLRTMDIKEVMAEEWKSFLIKILQETNYEVVVLDLGNSVQGLFEILDMCDKIYMPILEDIISNGKIQLYERQLLELKKESVMKKTKKFTAIKDMSVCAKQFVKEESY